MKHRNLFWTTLAIAILAAFAGVNARAASFTAIGTNASELNVFYFLDSVYGAGNYERISDDVDSTWFGDILEITVIGKQSSANQLLGVCVLCDGSDNLQFGPAVTADGILSLTLFDGLHAFDGAFFRWYDGAFGFPAVGTVYSDPTLNANGTDHMVSFAIKDRPGVFAFAFEDWLSNYRHGASDRDFNDFIVEVRFLADENVSDVPEPASLALLGGALLALGLAGRPRRRRA